MCNAHIRSNAQDRVMQMHETECEIVLFPKDITIVLEIDKFITNIKEMKEKRRHKFLLIIFSIHLTSLISMSCFLAALIIQDQYRDILTNSRAQFTIMVGGRKEKNILTQSSRLAISREHRHPFRPPTRHLRGPRIPGQVNVESNWSTCLVLVEYSVFCSLKCK